MLRVRRTRSLYATSDHVALYTIAVVVAGPQAVASNQSSQGVAFSGPDLKVGRTNREGHSPRATLYVRRSEGGGGEGEGGGGLISADARVGGAGRRRDGRATPLPLSAVRVVGISS